MLKKETLVWGIVLVVAFILLFLFFGQPRTAQGPTTGPTSSTTEKSMMMNDGQSDDTVNPETLE